MAQDYPKFNIKASPKSLGTILRTTFAFWLIGSVMPFYAFAETSITKSISYFTINGNTAEELDDALTRHSPTSSASGLQHAGITKINFGGDVTFVSTEQSCALDRINVALTTNILLPRWRGRKAADTGLGITWDALSADIKRHEEQHAEIAKAHAEKLDLELKKLRPEKNCDVLQKKISQITQKVMRQHDREQTRFDRREGKEFERRLERLILEKQR